MKIEKLSDTVCIVGLSPTTRENVANEPPGVEIWSLNQGHSVFSDTVMQRMTRWFQVHPWEAMSRRQDPEKFHIEWLQSCQIPVYLEQERPDVPSGIRYPYEAVCATIGSNYFATNSLCYMTALAIHEGFKAIKIYGCDMGPKDVSDGYARPCMEFLLGIAVGKGINIWVSEECTLLTGDLYARNVPVPSYALEIAFDALQRTSVQLHEAAVAVASIYRSAVQGRAYHGASAVERPSVEQWLKGNRDGRGN